MRFTRCLPVLCLLCLPAFSAAGERAVLSGPIPAEVLDVVDGDTLAVRATIWLGQVVETYVRLEGVDTPERRSRCPDEKGMAEAATRLTRDLVADASVRLFDVVADKYGGRVRARVETASGVDLARRLIDSGLARPYYGGQRAPWCGEVAG